MAKPRNREVTPAMLRLINNVLDDEKRAHGVRHDKDLAPKLGENGVTPKTISEWRRGVGVGTFGVTFTPLLIKHRCPQATNDTA